LPQAPHSMAPSPRIGRNERLAVTSAPPAKPRKPKKPTGPKGPKRPRPTWPIALLLLAGWGVIVAVVLSLHWISSLPDISDLLAKSRSHDMTILDRTGRTVARPGLTQGRMVMASDLPAYVPNAFIAVEDRRFRYHFGLDPIGMARAAYENAVVGHVVQGGSTITQQLAKNLFLKPQRTLDRKIEEAMLALYLESRYSKEQILTLYLNRVYFGSGATGIEAAAQHFFGKPASQLTLTEAAMLAGSVKAPAIYNPDANADASMERAGIVLAAMRDAGFITASQERAADETRPRVMRDTATPGSKYFADWIRKLTGDYVGQQDEPLIVQTTFDLALQTEAERAVAYTLAQDGRAHRASEAALVSMSPDGAVRAMVGGKSKGDFDRATDAHRQPGSAFKPFVYLAAFERGHKPGDIMNDEPVSFGKWRPEDYDKDYEGPITLTRAFAKSSNVVAAELTEQIGAGAVVKTAYRLGIASPLDAVPSIALGSSGVTPLELTGAYAAFANGGTGVMPYAIVSIRTAEGKVLYTRQGTGPGRVMSADDAAELAGLMSEVVRSGTGRAAALGDRAVAGKTGTTQDFRDAWFVGFTADYVTGVWVGNDDSTPMKHVTGGTIPAHIFHDFMTAAETGLPLAPLPALAAVEPVATAAPAQPDASAPQADQPGAFERVLNSLFGGT